MIGARQRMPKRLRYPLFFVGIAIMVLGGIAANSYKAQPSTIGGVVALGFLFLIASVIVK